MYYYRDCSADSFFVPIGEVRECTHKCENVTMCGPLFAIPEEHLKVVLYLHALKNFQGAIISNFYGN